MTPREERLKKRLKETSHSLKLAYQRLSEIEAHHNIDMKSMRSKLERANADIDFLRKTLKQRNGQIKNLDANLTDAHYEIRTLNKAMMKKDEEIKRLNEKLSLEASSYE